MRGIIRQALQWTAASMVQELKSDLATTLDKIEVSGKALRNYDKSIHMELLNWSLVANSCFLCVHVYP